MGLRSERTLIGVLVVLATLSLVVAGGAGVYAATHREDAANDDLRQELVYLREANEKLFAELVTATRARNQAMQASDRLRRQLGANERELRRTRASLAAARRTIRAQARAARARSRAEAPGRRGLTSGR